MPPDIKWQRQESGISRFDRLLILWLINQIDQYKRFEVQFLFLKPWDLRDKSTAVMLKKKNIAAIQCGSCFSKHFY